MDVIARTLFAEWDSHALTVVVTLTFAGIGALLFKWRDVKVSLTAQGEKIKRDAYDEAMKRYEVLIKTLEDQSARKDKALEGQQRIIDLVRVGEADCRESLVEQRGTNRFFYDLCRRLHASVKALGGDPGELPEFREPGPLRELTGDFLAAQAQQRSQLLKDVDTQIGRAKADLKESDGANPDPGR